jgi:uncharacterized membrane protein
MTIKIPYLITVFVSVLLIIIGNKIAVNGRINFQNFSQDVVKAKVQKVIGRFTQNENSNDEHAFVLNDKIIFEAKITDGIRKGETVTAAQVFSGFATNVNAKEVAVGDNVILIDSIEEWYFNGYIRTNKLLGLGIFFALSVLIFGGKKGFNTILSLGLTCASIFAVFIPAILSGKNIYIMSLLVCAYTIAMTLFIVIGFNRKAFTAAVGCASGIVVTAIITVIMDKLLILSGVVDESSKYLASLPVENQINLRAIIFSGIIIGAMGAVMDVAMSISSSLWEIKEKAREINFKALLRSGLTIGRDIMGTMANTLILAYIGSSLSVVLILSVYSNSLLSLFNSEMIVVEILQALAGSLGILFSMPLTALFCSIIYLKKNKTA